MLNRFARLALASAFVTFVGTNVAYADHHEEEENPCGEETDSMDDMEEMDSMDGTDDMEEKSDTDEGAMDMAPATMGGNAGWPIEILHRPLTIPEGAINPHATLESLKFDTFGLTLGANYGLSDKLQFGASYGLSLKEFEVKGPLSVNADMAVVRDDKLEVLLHADVGYNLDAEALEPLVIGANGQYILNDKMGVLFGAHVNAFLEEVATLRPIFVDVALGFAYQVAPNVYAELNTGLAIIEVSDADTGFIFADFIPVQAVGYYSLDNTTDIGAGFDVDFKEAGDSWGIMVMARHFMGVN